MEIKVNPQDSRPIYAQVLNGIKLAIARGTIKPHEKLPSIRTLALTLLINPNTIARAYRELESEGIIYTRRGEGSFASPKPVGLSQKEKTGFLVEIVDALVTEANYLSMSDSELLAVIRERLRRESHDGGDAR